MDPPFLWNAGNISTEISVTGVLVAPKRGLSVFEISSSKFLKKLFTTRKRSLRRLCFYTYVSLCSQGEYLGRYPPVRYTPLGRYTPWAGTPPWASTPPLGQVHPPRQVHHPLGMYTSQTGTPPRQVHPPGQVFPLAVHAGIWSTSE